MLSRDSDLFIAGFNIFACIDAASDPLNGLCALRAIYIADSSLMGRPSKLDA
jgi:hypothetical protein